MVDLTGKRSYEDIMFMITCLCGRSVHEDILFLGLCYEDVMILKTENRAYCSACNWVIS